MADIEINIDYEKLADLVARKLFLLQQNSKEERPPIRGIRGLAKYIGCSVPFAQKLKDNKTIPSFEIQNRFYFKPDEVDNQLRTKPLKRHSRLNF
jgi:hypothetical protein